MKTTRERSSRTERAELFPTNGRPGGGVVRVVQTNEREPLVRQLASAARRLVSTVGREFVSQQGVCARAFASRFGTSVASASFAHRTLTNTHRNTHTHTYSDTAHTAKRKRFELRVASWLGSISFGARVSARTLSVCVSVSVLHVYMLVCHDSHGALSVGLVDDRS